MKYTQFLVFEVGSVCNLADHHQRCPSWTSDRYGDLDTTVELGDAEIVGCVKAAYETMGFRGHVAFHYYNEPMILWDRIVDLMETIQADATLAKLAQFTLWTNGTLLVRPQEMLGSGGEPVMTGTKGLELLSQIWVSNYRRRELGWLKEYVPDVRVLAGQLDDRRDPLPMADVSSCLRPFNELIIDNFGNGHLCCADWKGTSGLGNIRDQGGFREVVERYRRTRLGCAQDPMSPCPAVCCKCRIRQKGVGDLVASVRDLTNRDKPWEVFRSAES